MAGYVAVLVIELHFPEAGSLKAKRSELQSIKAHLHGRFAAAVAETAHHDRWQRATLTAVLVSGSLSHLNESADHLRGWLDARCPAGVSVERILVSTEDLAELAGPATIPAPR
jgi:hypothetical protein